jgi:microcin C transport system substrate-binding protein
LTAKTPPLFTRRASLWLAAGALAPVSALQGHALADMAPEGTEAHGLSVFGDLAMPPDFPHLPYADPKAPKGGQIVLQISGISGTQNFTTFNTLNTVILKGDGAAGMGLIFDTLMTGSADEPDALYGLVAKSVRVSQDKMSYRFTLRKEARFHDGSPLTAKDVVFSINILKTKGHPTFRMPLRDVAGVEAEADDVVTIRFNPTRSREAPLFVAGLPIFSAAYYASHAFDATTLEPPLGSAAYKVGPFSQGRYIAFSRVPDYWGKDLPINLGTANFDTIRFEYFSDRKVAFEAFKAGVFTFREEFTSAVWATGYNFPAATSGRVKRETLPDDTPNGTQGWFFNTRRDKFRDPRVREAIGYCFDFKWTNANLMYGVYKRTVSFFQNSPMEATGTPSPEELKELEPFRAKLPPDVFGPVYMPPESDGSGADRALLRKAMVMLEGAGCKRQGSTLMLPDGRPLDIEFLDYDGSLEPHTGAFIRNLRLLGINAQYRVVDAAQYKRRLDEFDFDIITERFGFGFTPGEGMRDNFSSEAAKMSGSRNLCGVSDPVVDALIAKALVAESRESLTILCKDIDRVLRAGHYWVPMWNKSSHLVAYWDLFSRPAQNPKYGLSPTGTWWYDEDKAKKTALQTH